MLFPKISIALVVMVAIVIIAVGLFALYFNNPNNVSINLDEIDEISDEIDVEGDETRNIELQESCEKTEVIPSSLIGDPVSDDTDLFTVGNTIGVEGVPGILFHGIERLEEKVAFRFTSSQTGEVRSVAINILDSTINWTGFQVGLQEDNGSGNPNGIWIGKPEQGNTITDSDRFITIEINSQVKLLKDRVYHLVIEPTEIPLEEINFKVRAFNINYPFQPFNKEIPELLLRDDVINTIYFDGNRWEETNNWPIFVVKFNDESALGQPYSLVAQWVTYGERSFGQQVIPTSDYIVEKFGFSVSIPDSPEDNLCYEVRDSENKILAKGFFASHEDLAKYAKFTEVTLDPPLKMEQYKSYQFVLFSPKAKLENPYHIMGHEFVFDQQIGYGGTRNILIGSSDSRSSWYDWKDADFIFTLSVRKL